MEVCTIMLLWHTVHSNTMWAKMNNRWTSDDDRCNVVNGIYWMFRCNLYKYCTCPTSLPVLCAFQRFQKYMTGANIRNSTDYFSFWKFNILDTLRRLYLFFLGFEHNTGRISNMYDRLKWYTLAETTYTIYIHKLQDIVQSLKENA